ncbi:MAG: hypothetical protein ABI467_30370 [Kofleriaceae bacterium]
MKQLLFVVALAACGGTKTTTAPTTPPAVAPAASTTLDLGEITVYDGSDAMLKLHANGTTEMGGHTNGAVTYKAGPVLATDGTATYDGKPVAKLNADGTVMDLTENKLVPVTVTADKLTITAGGGQSAEILLNADGTMVIPNSGSKGPARVEGADTAGKRRAVLLMVAMLMAGSGTVTTSGQSGPEAAAPEVAPAPPTKK